MPTPCKQISGEPGYPESVENIHLEGFATDLPALISSESRVKVSAVIITYNEAKYIRRTLSRLHWWCDEIIIIDNFSTDDTVAICREFICNIYLKTFEGYGAQKQYAVSKASNDWILSIDAHEVLSSSLIVEILDQLGRNEGYTGYRLATSLVFFGQEFLYGKESWRYFLRLFNKNHGNFTDCPVHGKVKVAGPTLKLRNKISRCYLSLQQWEEKCSRYTTVAARKAVAEGRRRPLFPFRFSLPFYFFRCYLLELNFLNGIKGFYWSVLNAHYHFVKDTKIRELHRWERNNHVFHT